MYITNMYFSLNDILKNEPNKKYKKYANIMKKIVRINVWDTELIIFSCGYVFRKDERYKNVKWKMLNLNKKHNNGYIHIILTNNNKEIKLFYLHRIIFYAFNQERFDIYDSSIDNSIDHINGNPSDNRLSNLRNISQQHNLFNKKKAKGYYFDKDRNKYQARIVIDGKFKHLGLFKTKCEARLCYLLNKKYYHKITEL